jgi:hypothetical protein
MHLSLFYRFFNFELILFIFSINPLRLCLPPHISTQGGATLFLSTHGGTAAVLLISLHYCIFYFLFVVTHSRRHNRRLPISFYSWMFFFMFTHILKKASICKLFQKNRCQYWRFQITNKHKLKLHSIWN